LKHKTGKRDAEFVRSYQSGDKTAWDALCGEYEPRLAKFFYSWKIENPEDIQDLVQDTLLAAMVVINSIRKPASFNSWLFTIADRKRLRWLKKMKRRESYESSANEFVETDVKSAPAHLEPEHVTINNEYLEIALCLMKHLSQNQRMSILLSAKGTSQKDIAETLGITINNVKVLVMRGREKLKVLIKAKYPDDFTYIVGSEVMQSLFGK